MANVFGNTLPLILRQNGQYRKYAPQRHRNIVNIVHGADSFTGKWHVNLLCFSVPAPCAYSDTPACTLSGACTFTPDWLVFSLIRVSVSRFSRFVLALKLTA